MKEMTLTNMQKKCVDYDSGDLLIKGIAGSGKSVILLKRTQKLLQRKELSNDKIGFLTYTNVLIEYSQDIIDCYFNKSKDIYISTVDKYFFDLFRKLNNTLGNKKDVKIINYYKFQLKKSIKKRGYDNNFREKITVNFIIEEIKWLLGKDINTLEEYLESGRVGRGSHIRLGTDEKNKIFNVYNDLILYLENENKMIYSMIPNFIFKNINKVSPSDYFEYLLVDEAQDLSLIKLKTLKALTNKSITIAADHAQKIYNTSFTWKEVGINIRGRASKSLDKTFRSTKQIIKLANSMIINNKELLEGGEYTRPELPKFEGPKPLLYTFCDKRNHDSHLVQVLKNLISQNKTVGVLYRSKKWFNSLRKILINQKIKYSHVKKNTKKSKKNWNLLKPGVNLVTMHSVTFHFITIGFFKLIESIKI